MSDNGRDRAIQLVGVEVSVDFTKHTLLLSAHEHEQKQRKRENCNRHSQGLKRSQLSNRHRDCATQLVVVESSVDFKKHTLLLSAHEQKIERYSSNKTIEIVTDKSCSAVNCPIDVGIVPLS